jgi:hypothetical protein
MTAGFSSPETMSNHTVTRARSRSPSVIIGSSAAVNMAQNAAAAAGIQASHSASTTAKTRVAANHVNRSRSQSIELSHPPHRLSRQDAFRDSKTSQVASQAFDHTPPLSHPSEEL